MKAANDNFVRSNQLAMHGGATPPDNRLLMLGSMMAWLRRSTHLDPCIRDVKVLEIRRAIELHKGECELHGVRIYTTPAGWELGL